ncbi:MAG: FAD-binding protein [Deferribacteraceae bacterium]|jgi:fumarate reductase flavoprotein subunit|nr:FAD-binding protein [Deferribacteraceae bacterium]
MYTKNLIVAACCFVFFALNSFAAKVYNTDLVVVGSGVAGITAATYAAENGIKVVLLEKTAVIGGQLFLIEGTFAVESPIQFADMVGLTKQKAFKQTMDYAAWKTDASLVKRIIDNSAETIVWLQKKGVEMGALITDTPDGNRTYHTYKSGNPGKQFVDSMLKVLKANKTIILTETKGEQFIVNPKGEVTGIKARDTANDEDIVVNAKAVVMATGSYAQNREILLKYNPYYPADIHANGLKTNFGDGIVMGLAIGADVANMTTILSEGAVPTNTDYDELYTDRKMLQAYMVLKTKSLWVNKFGNRFMNEDLSGDFTVVQNALVTNGHSQIVVMDAYYRDDLMKITGAHTNYFTLFGRGEKIDLFDEILADGIKRGYAWKANTIEDLAKQMKINPATLKASVERYNQLANTGEDSDFGKDSYLMRPLVKAPFYAFRGENTICDTAGGLKINRNAQVLHTEGYPIKGLYAAGAVSGGMYGENYPYIMPGFASASAINAGRFAVEHFAETFLNKKIK